MDLSLKLALRHLAKAPGFAAISIVMLALGVAMSTAVFSLTSSALLRPMPFPHAERLVRVFTTSAHDDTMPIAPGNAIDLCAQLGDIGEFGLMLQSAENVSEPGQPPETEWGLTFDAKGLKILGVQPELGRGFLPDEDRPGKQPVVLLTHSFWRDQFGSDPNVLGKTLRIGSTNHIVIGVLPPVFEQPLLFYGCKYVNVMTVWPNWHSERTAKWMQVIGTLHEGVRMNQAEARLKAFASLLAKEHPAEVGDDQMRFAPLASSFAGARIQMIYWLVVGLAVLVLLIACANLGGVQLARAFSRRSELAVRTALGATRWHLIRVLATECALLALAGVGLGVLATFWSASLLSHWLGGPPVPMDWRVLGFAIGTGLIALICFSIAPAWFISDEALTSATNRGTRTTTGGAGWLKQSLIAVQLGLAVTLVCTAVAFVVGVRAFLNRDRGWQPDGLAVASLRLTWELQQNQVAKPTLVEHLQTSLSAMPGVQGVALATTQPRFGYQDQEKFIVEGASAVAPGREPHAFATGVTPNFFQVLGIPLREGRIFGRYRKGDPLTLVISAATARHFWPGQSAIGKRVRFGTDRPWREVIGVVGDATMAVGFDLPGTLWQSYRPIEESTNQSYEVAIRAAVPAGRLEKEVRRSVSEVDPDIIVRVIDLPEALSRITGSRHLEIILMVFAASGLLIALIGLYGVMTQLMNQRRREIGIRMALGAQYPSVMGLMLMQGIRLLAIGLAGGLGCAFAVRIVLHNALPELPAFGLVGQVLVGLALVAAGLGACFLPSHRAARVNPVEVLRCE